MTRKQAVTVFLLCFVGAMAFAQTNRGGISGVVKDQSGAVIPGASLTVVNVGTNETRKVKSTDLGGFTVVDLDPVTYKITVEAQGFKKHVLDGVKVDTGSMAS